MRMPRYMTGKTRTENGKVILHIKVKWWGWPILFVKMLMKKQRKACVWAELDSDKGVWEPECGSMHIINSGTPAENGMRFCCYCGKRLEERRE